MRKTKLVAWCSLAFFTTLSARAPAQTVVLDATDALQGISMMNMINEGEQLQQQRYQSLMQHPPMGGIGAGGGAGMSPAAMRAEADLLRRRTEEYDGFQPSQSTIPHDLAARLIPNDAQKQHRVETLLTNLLGQYRQVAKANNLALNEVSGAYMFLVMKAYAANNDGNVALTPKVYKDLRFGLHGYVSLLQVKGGALSDAAKQRMYDAVALEGMILGSATDLAQRRHDTHRASQIGAQASKIMMSMFGKSPGTTPLPQFANDLSLTTLKMLMSDIHG